MDDLSAMESIYMPGSETETKGKKEYVAPLLDLYSMMVVDGRCNTMRILSLYMRVKHEYEQRETTDRPDAFAQFGFIDTVPDTEYILILPHADRAPAYLWPPVLVGRRDA